MGEYEKARTSRQAIRKTLTEQDAQYQVYQQEIFSLEIIL